MARTPLRAAAAISRVFSSFAIFIPNLAEWRSVAGGDVVWTTKACRLHDARLENPRQIHRVRRLSAYQPPRPAAMKAAIVGQVSPLGRMLSQAKLFKAP